jgi:hypothetical protein
VGFRISLAAVALVACNGSSAVDADPINNGEGLPSCVNVDPCFAEAGACFTCWESAGSICTCPEAGPDANPYRSVCVGTEELCTRTN